MRGLVLFSSLHITSKILGTGQRGRGESKKEERLNLEFSERSLFFTKRVNGHCHPGLGSSGLQWSEKREGKNQNSLVRNTASDAIWN